MIASIIVAMDEQRGIGKVGCLPWRLSADLQRFKSLTMGHTLIMGRKTFESIGRALPGRTSIVVTRNAAYHPPDCLIAHSPAEALTLAEKNGESEAFIIGGGEIFAQALQIAERIYLTLIHTVTEADVHFPKYAEEDWTVRESSFHPADEKNEISSTFYVLEKQRGITQTSANASPIL